MIAGGVSQEALDTTCAVETPEHVVFHQQLAGPARRGIAWLVDLALRSVVLLVIVGVLSLTRVVEGLGTGMILLTLFGLEWGYYVVCETLMGGRSPGKALLSLRVVKEDGRPIGFGDSVLRNLLRAADCLPATPLGVGSYVVGAAVMCCGAKFQRLGDRAAGTVVVWEAEARLQRPLQLSRAPTARELATIPARPALTADEIEALELFARKREALSELRADELADLLAPTLARRLGLRYRDSTRFLELLHYRATERA